MNPTLLFDFSVNKENKTIHVKREFAADLPLVWKAWTDAEILDQWWGPEPWKTETKSMDFREGGRWLYAMVGPEGERHWSIADYITINQEKSFSANDGFCDEDGNINTGMPQSRWENVFTFDGTNTTVDITIRHEQLEDLEAIIEMGFKKGFTKGLNQLDQLLAKLKK
ncbi:SRPBCC family protein [Niabella aquatica]